MKLRGFNDAKTKDIERIKRKDTYETINALYEVREIDINVFTKTIFALPPNESAGLKILTTKQTFQRRLPNTLAQV